MKLWIVEAKWNVPEPGRKRCSWTVDIPDNRAWPFTTKREALECIDALQPHYPAAKLRARAWVPRGK